LKERGIAFIIGARNTKRVKEALSSFDEVKGNVYATQLVVESKGAEVIREEVLLVAGLMARTGSLFYVGA